MTATLSEEMTSSSPARTIPSERPRRRGPAPSPRNGRPVTRVASIRGAAPVRLLVTLTDNELLTAPTALGADAELRLKTMLTPWRVEALLASGGAVAIGVSGIATTTTELATILCSVSLAGLLVLLAAEARARRRWTVR